MRVSTLRVIGHWLGPHEPNWPDVLDFVDPDASAVGRKILAVRLESAPRTDRAYMGYSTCRICGCLNGNGEFTDGTFVWPEGLAHYVGAHNVVLPRDVEESLMSADIPPTETIDWAISGDESCRDYEWWRSVAVDD